MKLLLLLLVIAILIVLGIVIYDTNRFVIREYDLTGHKVNLPYRFVMLSDLHGKYFGKNNEKLLEAIEKLKPDAVYIAGDMITARPGKNFDETTKLIQKLADGRPVFYASGNHEYRIRIYPEKYGDMSERFENAIRHPNVIRLENENFLLEKENIRIYGVEIDREFYKKWHAPAMTGEYLVQKLGAIQEDKFNILIAHNPDYFPAYAEYGADLVLSGHVHGGIARIPFLGGVISPTLRLFPKYDGGLYRKKKSVMILGRGLGTHTIPVRFLNPGELIVVTLTPEN